MEILWDNKIRYLLEVYVVLKIHMMWACNYWNVLCCSSREHIIW